MSLGPIMLDVDTGSGSITISATQGDEVTIRGEISIGRRWFGAKPSNADEMIQQLQDNPPIELSGNRLRVGYIDDRNIRKRVSISYEISVPASTEVSSSEATSRAATVFTMSCTVQPRLKSLTGFRSPCSTGPIASASADRCTAL